MFGLRLGNFTPGTAATKKRPVETIRMRAFLAARDVGVETTTWREDALKGATIGALVFLGAALLFGVAYWFP